MKLLSKALFVTLAVSTLALGAAQAAEEKTATYYQADPARSTIEIKAKRGEKDVTLKFKEFDALVTIDKDPSHNSVSLVVYPETVTTGDAKLDADLKGKSFFDVKEYGTWEYSTTAPFRNVKGNEFDTPGNMRFREIERGNSLLHVVDLGPVAGKPKTKVWQVSFPLKRTPYGLVGTPGQAGELSEDMTLSMKLEMKEID